MGKILDLILETEHAHEQATSWADHLTRPDWPRTDQQLAVDQFNMQQTQLWALLAIAGELRLERWTKE